MFQLNISEMSDEELDQRLRRNIHYNTHGQLSGAISLIADELDRRQAKYEATMNDKQPSNEH